MWRLLRQRDRCHVIARLAYQDTGVGIKRVSGFRSDTASVQDLASTLVFVFKFIRYTRSAERYRKRG